MKHPGRSRRRFGRNLLFLLILRGLAAADAPAPPADFRLGPPPGESIGLRPDEIRPAKGFADDAPILGTYLFYWYNDATREHFVNADGSDALVDHPARPEGYSYESPDWWRAELRDIRSAGIDFILPVFWGVPNHPKGWSFVGLRHLVTAWGRMKRAGEDPPQVGLFYDTSTLQWNPQRVHVELGTGWGTDWFYGTIRDFFSLIPPRMWVMRRGGPVVFLYSAAFARGKDPKLFAEMKRRFRRDFACEPYLVKEVSWPGDADADYAWGGALGLRLHSVASLGPGYDHHAVPGRAPLVVPREDGAFYRRSWERFLRLDPGRRPPILMVETWNELHEGTDIAHTKEYGRMYIELTAGYARRFHAGEKLTPSGPFAGAREVSIDVDPTLESKGLKIPNLEDGLREEATLGGRRCLRTAPNRFGTVRYIYLDLDESFAFEHDGSPVELRVTYWAEGVRTISVEFDGLDEKASVRQGAFQPAGAIAVEKENAWAEAKVVIRGGRFANRSNGADLRLGIDGGALGIARAAVRRSP